MTPAAVKSGATAETVVGDSASNTAERDPLIWLIILGFNFIVGFRFQKFVTYSQIVTAALHR